MYSSEERRRFIRLNTLVDVVYSKRLPSPEEKLTFTRNISKGGICLIVYEEMKQTDILDLKIFLAETKTPINAVGKVVWINEFIIGDSSKLRRFDAGIEFIEISEGDRDKINKYVFRHL